MDISNTKFSVIGAGISGLAVAIALAQKGGQVTVYEQALELGEVGAGLQISPNGVAVLAALGLKDAVAKFANVPDFIKLRDYKGRDVAQLPLGDHSVQSHGNPYWQVHRADLLNALADGAKHAGVRIIFDHAVSNVIRNGAGALIEFKNQPSQLVDCLIAADGLRSPTRETVFKGEKASFTGQVAWRGLVPAYRLPDGLFGNHVQVFMGKGRHVVAYPLRGGALINFVAVEERADWQSEGWNIPDDPKNLQKSFEGWCEPVTELLKAVDSTFLWGLFSHPVLPRWSDGQVTLIGDACHPMLPFLAQGAVMALEDAWVLANCLQNAQNISDGLRQYENRRKNRATRVQKAAKRNAWGYHLRVPIFRDVAHSILRATPPNKLLAKYDWLYGHDVTRD